MLYKNLLQEYFKGNKLEQYSAKLITNCIEF